MKRKNIAIPAVAMLVLAAASTSAPVRTDVSGTTLMTVSPSPPWIITLTVDTEDANGENIVILDFDNNDEVASISTVDGGDPGPVRLIVGSSPTLRPSNVRVISWGVGELVIESMSITGNLGHPTLNFPAIVASRIGTLRVEGNVTRSIVSRRNDVSSAVNPGIDEIRVLGNLAGSVNFHPQSTPLIGEGAVGQILVDGNIGSSTASVTILGPLGIGSIEADDINAVINAVVDGHDPADIGAIMR